MNGLYAWCIVVSGAVAATVGWAMTRDDASRWDWMIVGAVSIVAGVVSCALGIEMAWNAIFPEAGK